MSYDEHFTFTTVPYWVSLHPQASRGASSYVAPPQQQPQQQLQGSSGQVPYWVTAYPQASRSYVAPPQQQPQQQLQGSSGQVPYWVTAYPQASRSYVAPPQQQPQQQLQGPSGQVPYWVTAYPQASRSYVAPPQQQPQQQLQGPSGQVPYWVTAYPQASRSCVARRELRLNQSCMELPSHRVEVPHEERTEHIQASYSFLAPQPEPAVDALHPFPGQREVIGDDFMTDPRMLDHRCIPVERAKDKANRMSYECLQTTRKNPEATLRPTQSYWLKVINQIENMEWEDIEKRMKVMHHFFKGGYESRRSAYSKAVKEGSAEVDMNNVPDPLRILPDGRTFLHYQQPTMHIYYSEDVIKRAIDNGLWALIGDGIHKLNPRSKRGSSVRMEEGQLYTIHGVCRGGFEVPLLFAITRRKREEEYVIVFEKMKQALESASESDPQSEFELTIVVDYELAAINAAKRVFPRCAIEGCCWHLSQAWVRRRNTLGILQFLKGRGKCGRVTRWWRTLKGLPFLPREMFHLVNALRRPPVPASHPAYLPCKKFLNYLQSTWLRGPFEKMWCKYMVHEQRTTNVAENYHMRLRQMIGKYHPPLTELILVLRSVVAVAKATLSRMETFPNEMKKLRRKDRVRREKIEAAMSTFEASIQGGQNPSMAEIGRYCRKMSRYTSDKAV
ncbi:hypothetical protein RB195_017707 [Necator americanus]|uniref:MULE transposase domain-containing protein n=1 Tax=Necator americanus TaxID=51031 RepID=A0ABR1C7F8_NECAM